MDARQFQLGPGELGFFGTGLVRPECALCLGDGVVITSHSGGGVSVIGADGARRDILGQRAGQAPVMTNGFALTQAGDFLLADLAEGGGGVWRLSSAGVLDPFVVEIDGLAVPPANFVGVDRRQRIWITVSTRHEPRSRAYRADVADGFIILVDQKGARVVADGLGYTNEAIVDPSGDWLYVNETFSRRTSRFPIHGDRIHGDRLGRRETFVEYGAGTFPDGLAFDEEGAFWMTSVVSNRIIRVTPDRRQHLVIEENDPARLAVIEDAFQAGGLGRAHLDTIQSAVMRSISSIAFGGADRRTAYLGNLLDNKLYTFRSPVPGIAPSHWGVRL